MANINSDLSNLTTIPEKTLDKLNNKILYIICQEIQENIMDENFVSEFDFYNLFKIYIKYEDSGNIRWKIIPSEKLEKAVINTVKNKLNLLEDTLNETLAKRFMEVYKDIC